ncbi:MAG: hypothetical protein EOO28_08045 [Comamonadaceae bacterium]|nr:MAG: hypothetical protein EOO28_08045 [Comamonadaceae bacterium]
MSHAFMPHLPLARRQAGLTLIELALAIALLGMVLLMVTQHLVGVSRTHLELKSTASLQDVEAAVLAFAFVHGRLPCPSAPSASRRGVETCDGRPGGYLAYRTLGIPDPSVASIGFQVDAPQLLASRTGAFKVLVPRVAGERRDIAAEGVPLKMLAGGEYDGLADFCALLLDTSATSAGGSVSTPAAAFHLLPADQVFGNWKGSAGRTVRRSTVASALGCAGLLPVAGFAHFNAGLEAAVMRRTLEDFQAQFHLAYGLYEWDFAQSNWFLANSLYSSLKATIKLQIARAAWLSSLQANPEPATAMALAAAALSTSSLHTSVYASTVARGAANLENARQDGRQLDELVAEARALERQLSGRAIASAENFFFLQQQHWPPAQGATYLEGLGANMPAPPSAPAALEPGRQARDYLEWIRVF